jgi:hypothetical protein
MEVTVLSIAPQSRSQFHQFESEGVRIVETPDLLKGSARTGWDPWNTLRRIGYLKADDYDLVHGLESRPAVALPALWLKRRAGLPVILDWADWYGRGGTATERGRLLSTFMHPVETFCEEAFHPLADGVVAMGEPLLERAAALGVPRERMINLLHGCDHEGLTAHPVDQARSRLERVPERRLRPGLRGRNAQYDGRAALHGAAHHQALGQSAGQGGLRGQPQAEGSSQLRVVRLHG